MEKLDAAETELIKLLREEASQVKGCFTQYSFQALAFSTVTLSLIVNYQRENPIVAVASVLIIVLVLSVARIGTHKYATANRNYGYQLHLERTARLSASAADGWSGSMRRLGWEEAMRAWRVVQATTFENLYTVGYWRTNTLCRKHHSIRYKWFEPESLLENGAGSHSGTYLGNMLTVLHMVAWFGLVPLFFLCWQVRVGGVLQLGGSITIFVLMFVAVVFRILKTTARRRILEEGLLSIHSCAVMWQAVAVAHYRALRAIGADRDGTLSSYRRYTENLSRQALDLNKDIENIHNWIERGHSVDGSGAPM